ARSLGRRSSYRDKQLAHRDAGRAPYPLCDASQDPEQGHRNRGRRAHQTCAQTAAAAAPLLDLGSRQGDGPPQEFHRRYQCAGLFLRSTQPLAARQQREHQRFAAPVFPARNRFLTLLASLPEQERAAPQSTPAKRPWGSKPLPIDYKRCCTDRLSPPPKADIWSSRHFSGNHAAWLRPTSATVEKTNEA